MMSRQWRLQYSFDQNYKKIIQNYFMSHTGYYLKGISVIKSHTPNISVLTGYYL